MGRPWPRLTSSTPAMSAVGRAFSGRAVELALSSYPGFHVTAPPGDASPYGVFRAGYVLATDVPHVTVLEDGTRVPIAAPTATTDLAPVADPHVSPYTAGETTRAPLG